MLKYTSPKGYTGVLYGQSSLSICDKDGIEVMHTGMRKPNTYDELVEVVDNFADFREKLCDCFEDIYNDTDEDNDI